MTADIFSLLILLSGFMVLAILLSTPGYACMGCGTRNGEHSEQCHFKNKD